jgi:amino-acid N-acetyltransferase
LVAQIEQVAKHSGIKALYLLTNTAANFFQTIGYQRIERNNFAESLKQTAQFTGLCPVSAVCMIKEI